MMLYTYMHIYSGNFSLYRHQVQSFCKTIYTVKRNCRIDKGFVACMHELQREFKNENTCACDVSVMAICFCLLD